MNNRIFPWIILVPERENMVEIFQLTEQDRRMLIDEIALASDVMNKIYSPDKINVAALGNQVAQLHVHIIARFKTDNAWPEPVWGKGVEAYDEHSALQNAAKIREACAAIKGFVTITNKP
jgi:hypothetical protein